MSWKLTRRGKFYKLYFYIEIIWLKRVREKDNNNQILMMFEIYYLLRKYSGRRITQDGQRDLDRIAMTLVDEEDDE